MTNRAKKGKAPQPYRIRDVFPDPDDPQAIRDREAFVRFALRFRPRSVETTETAKSEAA